MALAIDWSVPVKVNDCEGGKLCVEIPLQVTKSLNVKEDDVLCFTGFENGSIEIWSVKKGTYSSLGDTGAAERAFEQTSSNKEPS